MCTAEIIAIVEPWGLGQSRDQFFLISQKYRKTMNIFLLPTSRNVLPTFQTFCPDGVQTAQTLVHFAKFQVQARLAEHHTFTVPMHAVKFLYTATFHWGLKVATHCCVIVHLCFIQDQPDTTEINQVQLQPLGGEGGGGLKRGVYVGTYPQKGLCDCRVKNRGWGWNSGQKETPSRQKETPSGQFVQKVGKSA